MQYIYECSQCRIGSLPLVYLCSLGTMKMKIGLSSLADDTNAFIVNEFAASYPHPSPKIEKPGKFEKSSIPDTPTPPGRAMPQSCLNR